MEKNDEKNYTAGNPPPYSDNSPGPPIQMSTVVQTSPVVVTNAGFVVPIVVGPQMGPDPGPYVCESCHGQIVTRVETKASTKTHLFAALLCFLGGVFCVWIPYCVNSCQNVDHYCPNCNAYIGSYKN